MTKIKEKNVGGRPRHPTWEAFYEGLEMANQSHKWAICKFCPNNKKVRGIPEKMWEHIISCEQPFNQDILWTEIMTKNPFRFWKSVKKATPNLSMLAICLLSLPAASADAERFWSVMASIHTLKCNRLTKIKWHLITTKTSNNLTQTPMPIDNINLEFEVNEVSQDEVEENSIEDINELDQDITEEILNDLLDNITNLEKRGNEEIQNNGEFSGVEFGQIFDFNEINEININIV